MAVSENCSKYVVQVGDRTIQLTPGVLEVVHEYLHRPMSLEEFASKLGLESWEEAYEFLKKIPAWIMWMSVSLWRKKLEKEGCVEFLGGVEA